MTEGWPDASRVVEYERAERQSRHQTSKPDGPVRAARTGGAGKDLESQTKKGSHGPWKSGSIQPLPLGDQSTELQAAMAVELLAGESF